MFLFNPDVLDLSSYKVKKILNQNYNKIQNSGQFFQLWKTYSKMDIQSSELSSCASKPSGVRKMNCRSEFSLASAISKSIMIFRLT